MKFAQFFNNYELTIDSMDDNIEFRMPEFADNDFHDCIRELGGKTFHCGLYRVWNGHQILQATKSMKKVFPELEKRILCFGYDWLGRCFAIDKARKENNKPLILLLEPGAGESMQIPVPIIDFHNEELVNYGNDALAIDFFENWQATNNIVIQPNECVGYKIPLFLGGSDTVDNLEIIDMDIYIHICGQLRNKAMQLPNGATIHKISFDKF